MAQPLAKFSAGSVSAALWENEITVNGETKKVLKASVQRRYKDRDGNWKSSTSFSRNEAFLAIFCLVKAVAAMIGEGDVNVNGVQEEVVM